MNIITNALYLFIFIITLLYFKLPDVFNNNFLIHKFYLFWAVFAFYYIIKLIIQIKNGCKLNALSISKYSFTMALYSILGYSIYVDLLYMNSTCNYFSDITTVDPIKRIAIISLIIVTFIVIMELFGILFSSSSSDDCSL